MYSETEVFEMLQGIQSSIQNLTSKIDSLNQSSILGIDDDLIVRLHSELTRLQIDDDLIVGTFNEEVLLNKASYYFEHCDKITNKRAYLNKLLLQIPRYTKIVNENSGPAPGNVGLNKSEIDELLFKYNSLSKDIIDKVIYENESVMWLTKGIPWENYKTLHKVAITQAALKLGLLS